MEFHQRNICRSPSCEIKDVYDGEMILWTSLQIDIFCNRQRDKQIDVDLVNMDGQTRKCSLSTIKNAFPSDGPLVSGER